jgi:ubiquinone biosynthesis protein
MPKELMLYVKNMVFLDGAIARLAPDLDLLAEITTISAYFATRHGDRLAAEMGVHPMDVPLDLDGMKASFGVDASTETLTYRDLQKRRELIGKRLRDRS